MVVPSRTQVRVITTEPIGAKGNGKTTGQSRAASKGSGSAVAAAAASSVAAAVDAADDVSLFHQASQLLGEAMFVAEIVGVS
jgi:hypothetical protein